LQLRATYEFGHEGPQTKARRLPKKRRKTNRRKTKGKEAKDGLAHWPREDNPEPRSLQLPLEVRGTGGGNDAYACMRTNT
jgi:hypothetical protein